MKLPKNILYTIFLVFIASQLYGQKIKFKTLNTNDGLSNNSITDIVSDHDGKLWIATWDGLNSYNGNTFTVYKHDLKTPKSIAGNNIERLKIDREGHIWILTNDKKLSRYIGDGQFQNFIFDDAPPQYVTRTKNGNIAIKTSTSSYTFSEGKFVESEFSEEKQDDKRVLEDILQSKYPNTIINDVLKDRSGNIWYATRKNGVYIIPNNASNRDNEQIDHYVHDLYNPYSFKSNEVEKLYEDDFGNIWLGHKDGGLSMAYTAPNRLRP